MSDTRVNSNAYIQPHLSYKGKKEFSTELDQNAFMKLMLEQLKQQDPLSPMDNSQFLQQTSMMTMVEKITKMASLMEQSNNSMLTLREYESLVGRTATYDLQTKDELTGEVSHQKKSGVIEAVYLDQGKIYFRIQGEATPIPRDWIEGLESKGLSGNNLDSSLKYAQMIGYGITYTETATQPDGSQSTSESSGVIQAVSMRNGLVEFVLGDGKKVKLNQIVGYEAQASTFS